MGTLTLFLFFFFSEREIYVGQDGCEIQRNAGQRLCSLFPYDNEIDFSSLRRKEEKKKSTKERPRSPSRRKYFHSSGRVVLPSLFENRVSYTQFKRAKRYILMWFFFLLFVC